MHCLSTQETQLRQIETLKRGHPLEYYLHQVAFPESKLNICPQLDSRAALFLLARTYQKNRDDVCNGAVVRIPDQNTYTEKPRLTQAELHVCGKILCEKTIKIPF